MMRRGLPLNVSTDGALVALSPIFTVVAQRSLLLLPLLVVTAGFVYRSTRTALDHEHEANHDVLTTLLNRRAFMQRVSDELVDRAPTRYCGLILIDLDDFKQINDRLGHAVGDRVLQEVGRRLGSRSGEIAARLGGDEFAVLFTQVASPLVAQRKADALLAALSEPFGDLGFPLAISASVGVSVWPHDGDDADQLLQSADLAMYSAKRTGNSAHLYQHVQGSREVGRVTLLGDLQAALTNHELVLWYQPQMQLATTTISGFEALIRWNHPRHGMVPPDQFMPLAEHTDLMGPITRFVVDRAAGDLAEWLRNDPTLRVAVNVSAQNLHDLDFPKFVSETLQRHAVPEDQFEIEITENAVLAHPERAHVVLDALTRSGVRVSIDDFGTGYSSLANLRSLPVTAIKVDRSFVTDMMTDADDRIVVRSVIDLGCSLGLIVIAEGVETDECLVELERMGCHAAQGWAIARPMPAAEVPTWLAAGCHRATSPIAALGTEQAAIPRIGLAS
jgi:diguanylate cyclase (GGDEF)-like protein